MIPPHAQKSAPDVDMVMHRRLGFLSHKCAKADPSLALQICLSHFACPTTKDIQSNADSWMIHQVVDASSLYVNVWFGQKGLMYLTF